jgi:hypothetical protein
MSHGRDVNLQPSVSTSEPENRDYFQPVRWFVWLILVVLSAALIVGPKVSTNLGVEAPSGDKSGHDHVWRVWWRARHGIVDFGPSWGFTVVYIALALAFVALSALAVWIALVPSERAPSRLESPSTDLAASQ